MMKNGDFDDPNRLTRCSPRVCYDDVQGKPFETTFDIVLTRLRNQAEARSRRNRRHSDQKYIICFGQTSRLLSSKQQGSAQRPPYKPWKYHVDFSAVLSGSHGCREHLPNRITQFFKNLAELAWLARPFLRQTDVESGLTPLGFIIASRARHMEKHQGQAYDSEQTCRNTAKTAIVKSVSECPDQKSAPAWGVRKIPRW